MAIQKNRMSGTSDELAAVANIYSSITLANGRLMEERNKTELAYQNTINQQQELLKDSQETILELKKALALSELRNQCIEMVYKEELEIVETREEVLKNELYLAKLKILSIATRFIPLTISTASTTNQNPFNMDKIKEVVEFAHYVKKELATEVDLLWERALSGELEQDIKDLKASTEAMRQENEESEQKEPNKD